MKRLMIVTAAAALLAMATLPTEAGISRSWIGGSATWDGTTDANWSPAGVPTNTDSVSISQSGVSVTYTATNLSGAGLNDFNVMNGGTGTTTFTLDGTDILPVKLVVSVGRYATNAASLHLTENAVLTINGTGSGLILGWTNGAGPFVLNQTGGIFSNGIAAGSLMYVYPNGTYNLSGGSYIANRNLDLHGGTFHQTGGAVTLADGYGMDIKANSTFILASGTFTQGGASILIGTNASVSWTGGTLLGDMGRIKTTGSGASWTMQGGTATVNRSGNTSASKDSFLLVASSTVQGYGKIQDSRFGLSSPATMDNSGRIVANGYGEDRALDLSRFHSTLLTNTTDNTTSNGWFAVNQGRLLLHSLTIPAGSSTTNWGETPADTSIDLVNSAQLTFTGATAGSLTGSLSAADCTSFPAAPPGATFTGVHTFTFTGTFTTCDLTIRYDDSIIPSAGQLVVWRSNGSAWVRLASTVNPDNRTAQVTGLTALGQFAVSRFVPKGTVVMIQ